MLNLEKLHNQKNLFHVHTSRCGHCAGNPTDEDFVLKAIEIGAEIITFTDHAPFPTDLFGCRMKIEELPEYIESLQKLKSKYAEKIEILIGLEIEYLPSFKTYYEELKSMKNLDLLIQGQHFFEYKDRISDFSCFYDSDDEPSGCGEAIVQGIESGLFDVIAHPDRIFKTATKWKNEFDSISRNICETALKKNAILEINESSKRRRNEYFYWDEFWNIFSEYPKIQTIRGLDAHQLCELMF